MALIVENGDGLSDSNTYISEADSDILLQAHPKADQWCTAASDEKEIALRAATMYLDRRFRFYGNTVGAVQALQWPRTRNFDTHGHEIETGTIPTQLQQAQAEIAVELFCDPSLSVTTADEAGTITNWSTDGVSVTFNAESGMSMAVTGKRFPGIEFLVKSFAVLRDMEDLNTFKLETQVTL